MNRRTQLVVTLSCMAGISDRPSADDQSFLLGCSQLKKPALLTVARITQMESSFGNHHQYHVCVGFPPMGLFEMRIKPQIQSNMKAKLRSKD